MEASRKKIVLIIVGVLLLVLIAGGFLIGFVVKKIGSRLTQAGLNIKDGKVSVKGQDGSTTTYGKAEIPAEWPADLPIYPGATVTFSGSNTDAKGKVATGMVLSTKDTPEAVFAYYKKELAKQGWAITGTTSANGTVSLALAKGTREAIVIAGASDGKTGIALSVGEK